MFKRSRLQQVRELLATGAKMPEIEAILASQGILPEVARETVIQVIEQNLHAETTAKNQAASAVRKAGVTYVALGIVTTILGAVLTWVGYEFREKFGVWYVMGGLILGGLSSAVRGAIQLTTSQEVENPLN